MGSAGSGVVARRRAYIALTAGVLVAMAACDSGGSATSAPSPTESAAPSRTPATSPASSRTTTPTSQPPGVAALLTGIPVALAVRDRVAVALALRATGGPAETSGLSQADVVYEEFPATGTSRQVAVFQSRDAGPVGPVGATLPLDRKVGSVFGGVFAYSGGTAKFVKMLDKAPMATVNALATPAAFLRRGSPTQTYGVLSSLRATAPRAVKPKTVFAFATTAGPSASVAPTAATTATVTLANGSRQEWTRGADRLWRRTTGAKAVRTADGGELAVANLTFQLTAYQRVFVKSSTGVSVLTPDVLGTGSATVCAATGCIAGTWQRRGYDASTNYFDSKRSAVRLSPGSTWVLLAPPGSTLALR